MFGVDGLALAGLCMCTKGYWGETKPVLIDLKKGSNSFQFTVRAPNKGLSIRKFKLKPVGS